MNIRKTFHPTVFLVTTICIILTTNLALLSASLSAGMAIPQADNPNPPASPLKLVFIHHSTGGNWLADPNQDQPYGGLGMALMNNNYFVSATNYGWGPDGIGDRTDIPNWPEWFTGPNSNEILAALYNENGQNIGDFGSWSRLPTNPGGENEIIMFKSCFPNSDLWGNPDDPPLSEPNDYEYTVANAKAVYNNILTYFETRQDKLFVVITAPPMAEASYVANDASTPAADRAANARAFNDWLVYDWLDSYAYNNVAVFDFYNVLTSNGSASRVDDTSTNEEPNDYALRPNGNHHYWNGSEIVHSQTVASDFSAYPYFSVDPETPDPWCDDHPTTAGHQKATAKFVQLLNVFYHRWKGAEATPTATRTPSTPTATRTATATSAPPTSTPTRTPTPTRTGVPSTSTPTRTPTPTRTGAPPTYRFVYLPLIMKSWSAPLPTSTATPTTVIPSHLIQPMDLVYQGAFRLPGGDTPPQTFAYGGNAMTFNPDGDPANTDPYPGSLFVMGHDRMAYGTLPDGNQVAEVSIPVPAIESNPADLPQAAFIQGFHDVTAGYFTQLEEIPKVGMQYLNHLATGPKIHLAWGQHLQPPDVPSHAWFNPTLGTPDLQGVWFIGYQNLYSTNGYMFDIPTSWADAHAESRYLATGRMRDGGQGGMGPALFAYRPWLPDGSPPVSGTHLAETTLLLYENAYTTEEIIRCLNGYQHPDEWEGGAWITTPSGKQAVLFAGTKSNGTKYWYGYLHPDGPAYPCVDAAVTDYVTCRMADGTPCPAEDFTGCCDENEGTCITYRGWWSTHFDAQFILYDPADLARVADGEIESWEPQPYASLDIDEHLYLDPPVWDRVSLGWGDQRRYRIGDVAYDRETALLYVLELYADGAKPVVHVWRVT